MSAHSLNSLVAFMAKHNLTLPSKEPWRMVRHQDQQWGEINALPQSRGVLRATNGILCYIEQPNGNLFLGHLDSFIPDRQEAVAFKKRYQAPKKADSFEQWVMNSLFA